MGNIIYLAHYCDLKSDRKNSLAAVAVMDYVIESLNKTGHDVTVISPLQLANNETRTREVVQVNEKTTCIFTPTLRKASKKNIPFRALQKIRREWNLMRELDRTVKDGDTLLVYHSLELMHAVRWIRKRRKICLVLQVCEIYSDAVESISQKDRKKEINYIGHADRYIFMSEMLAQELSAGRRYAVCNGVCKFSHFRLKKNTDKIHIVYSGTFSALKGGCSAAICAAEFLPEKYHLHILGTGSKLQIDSIQRQIRDISRKTKAKITYDGALLGEDYAGFLRQCDIGLSTQNPDKSYNATSFPSKIMSYMSNGLRVISARIPVVETSVVGRYIYYYDEQEPELIAKAIMDVDMSQPYDSCAIIEHLDKQFCVELDELCS